MVKQERVRGQLAKRSHFGLLGAAAGLSLLGLSAAQPPTLAEAPPCSIAQKKPLFVGFAKDMGLDDFEVTAAASVSIVREVKHWACENSEASELPVPSLQLALAQGGVRLERVQFADVTHAVVLLANDTRPYWQVRVARAEDSSWHVTHNRVSRASEETQARAQSR